jgi:hypothetical protein
VNVRSAASPSARTSTAKDAGESSSRSALRARSRGAWARYTAAPAGTRDGSGKGGGWASSRGSFSGWWPD